MEEENLPAWRTSLDFDAQDAGHYLDYVNPTVLGMLAEPPRRMLDLGCAGGMLGATVKQRHPQAVVVGVEAGRAAADKASTRIDRVIRSRLEDLDLAREGFDACTFDTVIAADILEHLVNPWELLARVKPFLTSRAQLIASIPNVRNLSLLSYVLLGGRWEYTRIGFLDVTHLRFFTLTEMHKMFAQTGYVVEHQAASILPALQPMYAAHKGKGMAELRSGRLTIRDVTPHELTELCAEGFVLRCRPS